jgi:putative phosphoribosyl transferase
MPFPPKPHTPSTVEDVTVGEAALPGQLTIPADAVGLILFAHGSGSSRLSVRNRAVASTLVAAGFVTLLFDLLTDAEAEVRANVFDIPLLASRLRDAALWATRDRRFADLPLGCFGASTGAAAALAAAAAGPPPVAAIVSRGGRPDLAGDALPHVHVPTLLIVGEADREVLALNRAAADRLGGPWRLVTVPGATHLFEEPGALDHVASLAAGWFVRHLAPAGAER